MRGIWGDDSESLLAALHEQLLRNVFSYLDLLDTTRASAVSKRFYHLLIDDERSWTAVDATSFVVATHRVFAEQDAARATERTSRLLAERLEGRLIHQLIIRGIGDRLDPDIFLPNLLTLTHLELTEFERLTDKHLHIYLVAPSLIHRRKTALRHLKLDCCSGLTNAAARSVAVLCPDLESVSLEGIPHMTALEPLKHLMNRTPQTIGSTKEERSVTPAPLMSLFTSPKMASSCHSVLAPQSPRTTLSTLFSPTDSPSTSSLTSTARKTLDYDWNKSEKEWRS